MRNPLSLAASAQCFTLAMLCALPREDGACGIRLQSGESKGRYKNSSATHTPTHRKAQVTQEQLLAALAAAGAVFAAAASCQRTPSLGPRPRALAGCSCAWGQLIPKPSCAVDGIFFPVYSQLQLGQINLEQRDVRLTTSFSQAMCYPSSPMVSDGVSEQEVLPRDCHPTPEPSFGCVVCHLHHIRPSGEVC